MTIVATQDTRNSEWASSSFGRKMLEKMGWKGDGVGLGKNQQGTSTHLRAVKRAESLGIGAETDAFGDSGWQQTNAAFHGVLANLKKEYSSNNSTSDDADDSKEARKKRKKEEKKRKKKEEKRRAKAAADGGASNDGRSGIRLAQNKVQAGHARKMREAKDIKNKSAADMAAIFGVKADFYKQPREWVATPAAEVTDSSTEVKVADNDYEESNERKKSKKSSKEKKKRKHSSDEEADTNREKKKKSKI
jgi:Pin2-interacting protein X1